MLSGPFACPHCKSPLTQIAHLDVGVRCGGCAWVCALPRSGLRLRRRAGTLDAVPEASVGMAAEVLDTVPVQAQRGAGLRVGRYELVSIIGSGGQGEVWLARHPHLSGWCVLKFLRSAEGGTGGADVGRLIKEASRGFKVSHGNVARVMDCDQHAGRWFLVMEYVDGADLSSLLPVLGPLPADQVIHVGLQLLAGLEAIHEAGLIHRDVKPANLLLTPRGVVKMTDLGVATLQQGFQTISDMTTMSPMFVGTPHYAAPEQFTLLEPPDPRTDIYAAGVTLFQLLTGRPPFEGNSVDELARQHVHAPVPSVTAHLPRVTPDASAAGMSSAARSGEVRLVELDRLIAGTMAKRRSDRPRSCAELIQELSACLPQRGEVGVIRTAEAPRGVAVLPFRNLHRNAADDWIADGLAAEIEAALARIPGLHVGDRHALVQRLRAMSESARPPGGTSIGPPGAADTQTAYALDYPDETVLTAARWIGVGTVVSGAYQRVGDQLRITASLLRGTNGTDRNVIRAAGAVDRLFELEDEVADGVVRRLGFARPEAGRADDSGTGAGGRAESRPASLAAYQHFLQAQRAFRQGEYRTAEKLTLEALAGDAGYLDALGLLGNIYTRLGQYDQALERYHELERLAVAADDEKSLAAVFANMGAMHYYTGQYERALDLLRQATDIESALDQRSDLAKNRCNIGNVLLRLDRADEAAAAFNEAIEIHRNVGDLVSLIPCYNGAGRCQVRLGNAAEARNHFQRALTLADEIGSRVEVGMSRLNLGSLATRGGDYVTAEEEFARALAGLESSGHLDGMSQAYEHIANMHLKRGCPDAAIGAIEQRIKLAVTQKNVTAEADAWEQMAKALEQSGKTLEAMDALRNAYKTSRKPGTLRISDPGTIRPPKGQSK